MEFWLSKRSESEYDTFGVGHLHFDIGGFRNGNRSNLNGDYNKQHIAVIGDASIAGMAEGLNHAGVTDANLLVILNDNAIGIDPSVGF
jgi:1-deoxy-D-xylulose-5-phosphate synthase